ncbi:aldehyde dehydrogenase [Paracoccus sediminis]|uniref:Aldehyde dehydrogenase n=1 Tax=Paracoccus sediminis TaxID=1214787 RepID=A0A238YFU0_9RHOB|nr:aldehyde dehydrogenase [Paracoccus sediminis]TBN46633.1 aldehyde dehydrogenase [Paracoccus sediminis]SNR69940.1 lactaldehyde dehydrogenase / glycolaldehyde dehydrogenase [Paracoccus sediminis]
MAMHQNFINGRFETVKADAIPVMNPARDTVISEIPDSSADAVGQAVAAAKAAQPAWEKRPAIERATMLRQISARIRENADEIARVIAEEQGKVMPLATVEAHFTANYIDYMAEWARRIEGEILQSDRPGETIFVFRQPLGVVGGILPWNFPFFLIARKMAPALITGNTIVIKPSEETPNNAALFARLVTETDLPQGVFNIVYGRGATTGRALTLHEDVKMVSFTGSVETGSKIMADAARNITKVNLELGGKAPAIVCADADLDLAASRIKAGRVLNTGAACNAPERIYVDRKVSDEFVEKLAREMKATRYGDPLGNDELDMGPVINKTQVGKMAALVDSALAAGAEAITGGKVADLGQGNHYEPTVLVNVRQDMDVIRHETFGPVLPVVTFADLDEAIGYANDTTYGLTSSIYTKDLATTMRACHELRFGETYVNRENFEAMQGFHAGRGKSGLGGADGRHGMLEYTETHLAYIQT